MNPTEIIAALAETGSIDALLTLDESLTREQIDAVLQEAASLFGREEAAPPPTSPLYNAHNGFMLGLFFGSFMFFDVRNETDRRDTTLRRITEFLMVLRHESGIKKSIDECADNMEDAIEEFAREADPDLADYYLLGLATFRYVVIGSTGEDTQEAIDEAQALLHRLGHPPILFLAALGQPEEFEESSEQTWQDMMTNCLRLARELVAGLEEENDTCFVAMPFCEPYEDRYLNFYRVSAATQKCRAIRAWGDLGKEEHQELLLALISKCGVLLADVTEPNANVTLEIGFALGRGMNVFLVGEEQHWKGTANIQLDWVYPYQASGGEWESEAADRAGLYFTALQSSRRPGPIPSWTAKPIEILKYVSDVFDRARETS